MSFVIGVLGQPARIAPPSKDEILTAIHEAAHGVFAQILPGLNDLGKIQIWHGEKEMHGFCGPHDSESCPTFNENQDYGFSPIDATMPHKWRAAALDAWTFSLSCFAGSAAMLVAENEDINAESIRWHQAAGYDNEIAEKVLSHHFDAANVDDMLNKAAEAAGIMCCAVPVWAAINSLANFLVRHGRHQSSIYETSVIVRNHIPQPWAAAPGSDWAMQFVKRQP
jgi:hypothetical protein